MSMTPVESLHYAVGELAYAIAMADGNIQKIEREKFANIVAAELRCENYGFNVSSIIFQVMDKSRHDPHDAYDAAIRQLKLYGHYVSPEMKACFYRVLEKIAEAFPPVTNEEKQLLQRFRGELESVKGDPIYYDAVNLKKARWKRDK